MTFIAEKAALRFLPLCIATQSYQSNCIYSSIVSLSLGQPWPGITFSYPPPLLRARRWYPDSPRKEKKDKVKIAKVKHCITQSALKFQKCKQVFVDQTFYFVSFCCCVRINLLQLTGYVMHQQFNIQQLYALPILYLCVLYLSENKQRLVPLTA